MALSSLATRIAELASQAYQVVSKHIHRTPVDLSNTFSRMSGCTVYLKYENLQKTGAFKVRGALFKTSRLVGKTRGVVAASAGNHAQGVAYAARVFGVKAVIVMPETATISKVEATKSYGAEVILHGRIYDDAEALAKKIAEEKGYTFIHAFDDPEIIAGQGTLGLELMEQLNSFDYVVVPIGGGGLASGVAAAIKSRRQGVKIIGVEPANVPKMAASLRAGKPVTVEPKPTIADGLATKKPGELTYRLVSELVDDIVLVSEEEIAYAIYMLLERGKVLAEGAGAASLAAILSGKLDCRGQRVVALVTGGNIDLTTLYRVLLRGLASQGRVARITGYIMDVPGELAKVLTTIAKHRGNVVDIYHDRSDAYAPAWHAKVTIVFEAPSKKVVEKILEELRLQGYVFRLEELG